MEPWLTDKDKSNTNVAKGLGSSGRYREYIVQLIDALDRTRCFLARKVDNSLKIRRHLRCWHMTFTI